MVLSCFSSEGHILNTFNSELAIAAAKGLSIKRCWEKALARAAKVLGESEWTVYQALPTAPCEFRGVLSVNGKESPCVIVFPEYGFPIVG